jgi:hypothetical protein
MAENVDNSTSDDLSDDELVAKVTEFYNAAVEGNQEWRDRGEKCRDFHSDQQWTDADRTALEHSGKPALTINRIKPTVGFIAGNQRQNRKDVRVLPLRNAGQSTADALTQLIKHTMDVSNADYEQAEQFVSGVIDGKGWLFVNISDDDEDLNRRTVKIQSISGFHVFEDPTADEYDLNETGKFVIREYWKDIDECKAQWPQVEGTSLSDRLGTLSTSWIDKAADWLLRRNDFAQSETDSDESRQTIRSKYRLRVVECWWKDYRTVGISTDKQAGSVLQLMKSGEMSKAKKLSNSQPEQYTYREQVKGVLCKTVIIGETMVEHIVDPFGGIYIFPFFRYCPYYDSGRAIGVVDALISPQEEENKRRSQALHHLNQSGNSGSLVGTIDPAYKATLQSFGSKPGVVIELDKCGGKFERLTPAPISQGHMDLAIAASQDIKEISGVANMVGYDSQQKESGLALSMRSRQGMTILEEVYDRFDYTCQLFGKFLVELIRRDLGGKPIYSDEEIDKILDWDEVIGADIVKDVLPQAMMQAQASVMPSEDPAADQQAIMVQAGEIAKQMAKEVLLHQLRDVATGRYNVQVSQSPNAPTAKVAAFLELSEIAKMYPGAIPADIVIEASDIRNKDKVVEAVKAQQQAMQAQQQQPAGVQ